NMLDSWAKGALLESLDSLRRRSMIEVDGSGRFTLQPVIMEYVTDHFVEQIYQEIAAETIGLLASHALTKAQAKDYLRTSQMRLILAPLAGMLLTAFDKAGCENKLKRLLSTQRKLHPQQPGYAVGNILNLLIQLQVDLHGF